MHPSPASSPYGQDRVQGEEVVEELGEEGPEGVVLGSPHVLHPDGAEGQKLHGVCTAQNVQGELPALRREVTSRK